MARMNIHYELLDNLLTTIVTVFRNQLHTYKESPLNHLKGLLRWTTHINDTHLSIHTNIDTTLRNAIIMQLIHGKAKD